VRRELEKLNGGTSLPVPADLDEQIRKYLDAYPGACWDQAVAAIAVKTM
jgi:hypothetical protein